MLGPSAAESTLVLEQPSRRAGASPLAPALRFLRREPLGAVGAALFLGLIFVALLAPVIAPANPLDIRASLVYRPPSAVAWFGTDKFGRDILSRVIYGARISLYVGVLVVAFGTTFGLIVGLFSAYIGGGVDTAVQRVVDSFQAFPALILALAVVAALGQHLNNVVLALSIVAWPVACRVVRSSVLSHRSMVYIEAARAIGCSDARIVFRHILPNVTSVYLILATSALGAAILGEAALSFLGAGIPPPTPSWGTMLNEGATTAVVYPWIPIFPGLAITLAVFAFNFLGDALRDYLDPRLRGSR
jgi:ABC-type dipeptide/oligopeptide/nickel transport system permease subunit